MSDHPETLDHVLAKLEPDSGYDGCRRISSFTPERQAVLSIALSLKRIADTLDGTTGIPIAQAIENAIGTGMFHGFQNNK